jgi:hypothetical protein
MLYNPHFSLPVAEAEAAWARAVGLPEDSDEEVRLGNAGRGALGAPDV